MTVSVGKLLLYHGSNQIVEKPRIIQPNRNLDFGCGFYTTLNEDQARSFAVKVARRVRSGLPVVNAFELDDDADKQCRWLKFEAADENWLNFVSAHRHGFDVDEPYDLIYGPVANDDVYRVLNLYEAGILSKEQTLSALKIRRLYDQLVFRNEHALSHLTYLRSYSEEG